MGNYIGNTSFHLTLTIAYALKATTALLSVSFLVTNLKATSVDEKYTLPCSSPVKLPAHNVHACAVVTCSQMSLTKANKGLTAASSAQSSTEWRFRPIYITTLARICLNQQVPQ